MHLYRRREWAVQGVDGGGARPHEANRIVGVIGSQRINYGRIIPVMDYTEHVIEWLLS